MKSKTQKLLILFLFAVLFAGSALFMYFKYIHNQPRIKIIAPKTEVDELKFDSILRAKTRQIKK